MKKKLALFGGKPILDRPLTERHYIGREEISAAMKVLKSGQLSGFVARNNQQFLGGPWVNKLEDRFCSYLKAKYAVSMNSATSALYAAVYALGMSPGDEVILPPYTMSATAGAVLACSGVPVFVDVDINNFCLDADKIEPLITRKTKAIIVVHLFGNPAEMNKIMRIAEKYKLRVLEDCAQSPGAAYQGRPVGRFGDIGVFSLNRHKVIQCGEGGVAITNDSKLVLKLRLIRNHAEAVIDEMDNPDKINLLGWNYKMTEVEAAISAAQINKLDGLNAIRIRNARYLTSRLKGFDWLIPYKPLKTIKTVYYRFPFRYKIENLGIKRSTVAKAMAAEGFLLNEGYVKPIYLQSIYRNTDLGKDPYLSVMHRSGYKYQEGLCPISERLYNKELLLSGITHTARNRKDIDLFIKALRKIKDNIKELIAYEKKP